MTVSGGWSHSSKSSHSAEGRSDGSEKMHRVQRANAIQLDDHVLGCKILHRQTKWVKFCKVPIISGKATNTKKTLNNVRS
jgi:hypothetical protein